METYSTFIFSSKEYFLVQYRFFFKKANSKMHAMAEEKSRLNVTRSSCKVADLLQTNSFHRFEPIYEWPTSLNSK